MIKYKITLILLLASQIAWGQLIEKSIHTQHNRTLKKNKNSIVNGRFDEGDDTILTLPFWDDFSTTDSIPSPALWVNNGNVDISGTIGINPPTYNVAVFNGVDADGIPYNIDDNGTVPVDTLISHRIDLTQVPTNRQNSIFLSFFLQPGGLGELPDPEDTFELFFLNDDSVWVSVDITPDPTTTVFSGGPSALTFSPDNPEEQIFLQVNVPIPNFIVGSDDTFIHEGFRFRFQASGNQQGTFDSWLLDYVYINYDRELGLDVFEDRAISLGVDATFGGYKSIPYDHFFDNRNDLSERFEFTLNNLDDELQPINFTIDLFDRNTGNSILRVDDNTEFLGGTGVGDNLDGLEIASDSSRLVLGSELITDRDTVLFDIKLFIDSEDTLGPAPTIPFNFRSNDTVTTQLNLVNTYAYDDGSAEFSAGINRDGAQIAVEYVLLSEDTLTGIEINFPILFPSSEDARIELFVRRNLRDETGSLAVAQRVATPGLLRNQSNDPGQVNFVFNLREHKILSDTIYVGFTQFTNNFVPIGLDKNNDNGDKIFVNIDDQWIRNNTVSGSLMIRPIFGTADPFIPTSNEEEVLNSNDLKVYPNPTDGILNIDGDFDHMQMFDLSGKEVFISSQNVSSNSYNIASLRDGIYIIRFLVNKKWITQKVIKN